MRPIDADAMREDWLENGENEYVYDTNAVLESIDVQPTIEAAPVVHGRWIEYHNEENGTWHYDCSVCDDGYAMTVKDYRPHNYCPNCGAKMDGDGNG